MTSAAYTWNSLRKVVQSCKNCHFKDYRSITNSREPCNTCEVTDWQTGMMRYRSWKWDGEFK